jgi:DNA gyrase subunit A
MPARLLLAERWPPGEVTSMLERAGASACRPDDLEPEFGLHDGRYRLSPAQAQAILDLRLHRLTGLEHEKLLKEYQDKLAEIRDLIDILEDPERLLQVIRGELEELAEEFGDERRTEIRDSQADLTAEDLITPEDRVVTLSHGGYAKRSRSASTRCSAAAAWARRHCPSRTRTSSSTC